MNIGPKDLDMWQAMRFAVLDDRIVPYLASLMERVSPVPVPGAGDAVYCDAELRVYFDPAYAARVGLSTFAADVGAHETAGHLFADHFVREQEHGVTDREVWGLATDMALNDGTVAHLAARHPGVFTPGGQKFASPTDANARRASRWVWPETHGLPCGLTAEQYYDLLLAKKQAQQQQGQQGQQGQQQQKQGGGSGQGGGQSRPSDPGTSAPIKPGEGAGKGSCGSCSGHEGAAAQSIVQKAIAHHGTLPGGVPAEERESLRQETAQAIVAHAQAHGQGSVPAGLLRAAERHLKPAKVDWKSRLRTVVRQGLAATGGDADWSMRRPRWKANVGNPRLVSPKARVAVVADTSGSMSGDDLGRVLAEVQGLLQSRRVERLWWIPTDAKADTVIRATNLDHARNALVGGGGTNMGEGLDAVSRRCRPRPHLTVVVTDGLTDWPRERPKGVGKVLVVLTRPSSSTPAWATTVNAY